MRRSATVWLATCLILGGPSVMVAEEPPGESFGIGGHVRLPEHGFAMTVPGDWVWLRVGEPMPAELDEAMARWSEAIVEHGVLLLTPAVPLDDSQPEICVVASLPNTSLSVTSQDFADAMTGPELAEQRREGFVEVSEPVVEWQDLPAGRTPRVDMTMRRPTQQTPAAQSIYFFVDPPTTLSLICADDAFPDDHWRSIAQGFEFLVLPEPAIEWQRVEFPVAGIAFSLPPDWEANPMDGMDGMDLVSPLGGPATCFLSDLAPFDLGSLEDIESWLISRAADDPDAPVVGRVPLPIGEALVVEREKAWDESGGDLKSYSLDLYIPTPRHHAWFRCGDIATSGDDVEAITLAIAETFEFLPARE